MPRFGRARFGGPRFGGGGSSSLTIPATAGLQIAATRPEIKNFSTPSTGGVTGMNSEIPHKFPNGTGRYLLASYDNFGVPNTTAGGVTFPAAFDNPCANDVTFTCSLSETDGSAFYQGRFVRIRHHDGTITALTNLPTSVTVPGGDSADAYFDLATSRAAGTWLTEHCYVSVNGGEWFFRHQALVNGARNEVVTATVGETDKSMQMYVGVKPGSGQNGAWASSIRHIDTPPSSLRHPTIFLTDSLGVGDYGWQRFLLNDTVPYVTLGRGTEPAVSPLANDSRYAYRKQIGALGGFTKVTIQYLTNDLVNSRTLSDFLSYRDGLITMAKGWVPTLTNADFMVSTLPPRTQSSDSFATTANQSIDSAVGAREQVRQDYNSNLRAGTSYGSATPQAWTHANGFRVADVGGAVEMMENSANGADSPLLIGKWPLVAGAATTADGLHPGTNPGRTAWAAAVPDVFFTV